MNKCDKCVNKEKISFILGVDIYGNDINHTKICCKINLEDPSKICIHDMNAKDFFEKLSHENDNKN